MAQPLSQFSPEFDYERPTVVSPSLLVEKMRADGWIRDEPWLAETLDLVRSEGVLESLTGVGRLMRLSTPVRGVFTLDQVLSDPECLPTAAFRAWLEAALSPEAVAWVEVAALWTADTWFCNATDWLDSPPEDLSAFLPHALLRDDLESLLTVLQAVGAADELQATLRRSDELLEVHQSVIMDIVLDDDRLSTVSWNEPYAWWVCLGDLGLAPRPQKASSAFWVPPMVDYFGTRSKAEERAVGDSSTGTIEVDETPDSGHSKNEAFAVGVGGVEPRGRPDGRQHHCSPSSSSSWSSSSSIGGKSFLSIALKVLHPNMRGQPAKMSVRTRTFAILRDSAE